MEKYENLGLVGEGSYGIVMKCKHKATGTLVAIKKFLESEDDRIVKRIADREIKMLRQLRHENLVNLIDVFKRKKKLYLVFEFVDYTLLDDLEKNPTGLEENYSKKILFQVLRGIEFCHSNDVIHRDIKPENILVSKTGIVKLCDFGFARPLSGQTNSFTDYVATRWYRAPELLVGDTKYGRPVDVWAIGCLASEMFAGDPLFPGDSDIDQLFHIIKCIGSICPKHVDIFKRNVLFKGLKMPEINERFSLEKRYIKMPKDVIKFIKKCLDPTPEERPSCSELLNFELFNSDFFKNVFVNEIKMKVFKERERNPLLKTAFKPGSSLSKLENNNNEAALNKPSADKPLVLKRDPTPLKLQTPLNYRLKQEEIHQTVHPISNQENELLGPNKQSSTIDEEIWENVRPLTSRKERVASRAGRISVIKDAFDNPEATEINVECLILQSETPILVDILQSATKRVSNTEKDSPIKLFGNSDSTPVIVKIDINTNKANVSPNYLEAHSQDSLIKSIIKPPPPPPPPPTNIQMKTFDNFPGNEKSLATDVNVNGSSPISNENVITHPAHHFSIAAKKPNLHIIANPSNNNTSVTSKLPMGNYPTLHQQHVNNTPYNFNVLKQMSTNFSQRSIGIPSENILHSYFPNIGKESKFRSNHFLFPSMAQSNKLFLNTTNGTGLKSPSPMSNERSGLYFNGFNKKKLFVNTRSNANPYQDHNISLPELKGAEIAITRNQPYNNGNTKYKYITGKTTVAGSEHHGTISSTMQMDSQEP